MQTKIFCLAAIISGFSIFISCNSEDKKEEKTELKSDSTGVTNPSNTAPGDVVPTITETVDAPVPFVVSITPEFYIEGGDGKNWNTQITFNVTSNGENFANFDGQTCCSSGKPGGSPNPTDWNPGDRIPHGIKTLPNYILNRTDITRDMLANSTAYLNWRPLSGRDACDGIRWTLTATFSDGSKAIYSRLETFANQSQPQKKESLLKDNKK